MYERNNVVRQFENAISRYCGAPYGIAVESCSMALLLSCLYHKVETVLIPRKTYFSVPMSIVHAGGKVEFEDITWRGAYQLKPYPIIDSAMRFKRDIYNPGDFQCLSFQYSKHLPIGRGGMILTDCRKAVSWLRKMRNDGRRECPKENDQVSLMGYNAYMTGDQAGRGLDLFYWRFFGRPDQSDLEMTHGDISYLKGGENVR